MSEFQKATVGRTVHFYNHSLAPHENNGTGVGPYAAVVTQVFDHESGLMNLKILRYGEAYDEGSVQPFEKEKNEQRYWVWPPKV